MKRIHFPLTILALIGGIALAQAQTSGAPTGGTGDARQQMLPSTQGATSSGQKGDSTMGAGQMGGGEAMEGQRAMPRKAKRKKSRRR